MKLRFRRRLYALGALLSSLLIFLVGIPSFLSWLRGSPRFGARIAYFVQVSGANLSLLPRLMVAIYDKDNFYALHLDLKIDELEGLEALRQTYAELGSRWGVGAGSNVPNLVVIRSEIVTYRGVTMTMNYLSGMNRLLAEGNWEYFVNLSGADYPTASQRTIRRLLGSVHGARNFVEWKPRGTWSGFAERRMGEFYIDTGLAKVYGEHSKYIDATGMNVSRQVAGGPRVLNPLVGHLDYTVAKTSGWFILSREFCEHLRGSSDARKMLVAMSFSDASDEHYFGTVLWNGGARWRESTVGSNLRSIFFVAPNGSFAVGEDGVRSRQHPFWVDDVDEKGELLFWEELERVPGFFTRKVREGSDFRDRVDREMIGLETVGTGAGGGGGGAGTSGVAVSLRQYETRLEERFRELIRKADAGRDESAWEEEEIAY